MGSMCAPSSAAEKRRGVAARRRDCFKFLSCRIPETWLDFSCRGREKERVREKGRERRRNPGEGKQ
uniref:Uncharacterized protein n=1 Tax=Anguilla anguilla TaxID=7936 RepID=A0A0E9SQV8_ANGAN